MILCSALELKKVQTAVSKHLGILPIIRGSSKSARVRVKTAFSATIVVCLVYSVMLCDISVNCDC